MLNGEGGVVSERRRTGGEEESRGLLWERWGLLWLIMWRK